MAVFHVVLTRSGPEYDLAKPLEEQSGFRQHADYMDGLVDDGFIILGGPLADEYRIVDVVEAESEAAVRAAFAADPWSDSHLHVDSIEAWTIRLDGGVRSPRRSGSGGFELLRRVAEVGPGPPRASTRCRA